MKQNVLGWFSHAKITHYFVRPIFEYSDVVLNFKM